MGDWPNEELISGAWPYKSEEDAMLLGHGEGGISPAASARMAEKILAEQRLYGGTKDEKPKPRPNGNPHLRGPYYDGLG